MSRATVAATGWDFSALLQAADAQAPRHERHLWLVRLADWLRRAPAAGQGGHGHGGSPGPGADAEAAEALAPGPPTPRPVLKLRQLLSTLERNPEPRARVVALLARTWDEADGAALFAEVGFSERHALVAELFERLRRRLLPGTPDCDLGELLPLMLGHPGDAQWLAAIDPSTLQRLAVLFGQAAAVASPGAASASAAAARAERAAPLLQALNWLATRVAATGLSAALRQRMDTNLLRQQPFEQLPPVVAQLTDALRRGDSAAAARHAAYLRALLQRLREANRSIDAHLEAQGVSVDIVFEQEQLRARLDRLEAVMDVLLAAAPARELQRLLVELVELVQSRRSLSALWGQHHALLARKMVERHAEVGEHYITRSRREYHQMLRAALGGGGVLGFTTILKFALGALALAPFWAGMAAGVNYALSFVLIYLLHWTVTTKQPAMTAPAMAARLTQVRGTLADQPQAVAGFVDEVTHLVRSQVAGIVGNLGAVVPVVLLLQALAWQFAGRPLVSPADAQYTLNSLTLLGPTPLYAAFTGVLLFASSLVAGWAENAFVYHRLDSALAHNPRIVARLGAARAARWAAWWRRHASGMAANVSLGLMLGLVPTLFAFFGLPIEVRHVTLSTGQLAAAVSTLGPSVLREAAPWWCLAGALLTGALNLAVSFGLALQLALRARRITGVDRRRLQGAVWQRFKARPSEFFLPRRESAAATA